jgi:hypothetical protein
MSRWPQDALSDLPALPAIALRHSEALSVFRRLGFQGGASPSTFYEYIKSLRKLGIPFAPGTLGYARKGHANYEYHQLMELALVLSLRVYHVVPDSLLRQVIRYRRALYRCYDRAYAERNNGLGSGIVAVAGDRAVSLHGVFLDLQVDFSGGTLTRFGPPKLLLPFDALATFADANLANRALLPMNISCLAERVVAEALAATTAASRAPRKRKSGRV